MSVPVQGQPVTIDWGSWLWCSAYSYVVIAVFIISTVAIFAYHLWQNHRSPAESNRLKECSIARKAAILVANDDGNAEIKRADKKNSGEGYMETKPSGKWKWYWTAMYPRKGIIPTDVPVTEGKDESKTRSMASVLTELNTKKLHLQGARIPLWVAVESKAVLMSLYGVAGIQVLELFEKWFNSEYPKDIFPIDIHAVKQMVFKASYNESQINALASDHEHIGEERAKKGEGLNKLVLIAGIAFGVIGMVALGIAAFVA